LEHKPKCAEESPPVPSAISALLLLGSGAKKLVFPPAGVALRAVEPSLEKGVRKAFWRFHVLALSLSVGGQKMSVFGLAIVSCLQLTSQQYLGQLFWLERGFWTVFQDGPISPWSFTVLGLSTFSPVNSFLPVDRSVNRSQGA
jgi:hypothetical protein